MRESFIHGLVSGGSPQNISGLYLDDLLQCALRAKDMGAIARIQLARKILLPGLSYAQENPEYDQLQTRLFGHVATRDLRGIQRAVRDGADPNGYSTLFGQRNIVQAGGDSISLDVLKTLLDLGLNPDRKTVNGSSILNICARSEFFDEKFLDYLLGLGLDINERNIDDTTPVNAHSDSRHATLSGLKLFKNRGADLGARDVRGFPPLVSYLHQCVEDGREGNSEIVRFLLSGQPDREYYGESYQDHHLYRNGPLPAMFLASRIKNFYPDLAGVFLEAGHSLNEKNRLTGNTLIMEKAKAGRIKDFPPMAFQELGGRLDIKNKQGNSVFNIALYESEVGDAVRTTVELLNYGVSDLIFSTSEQNPGKGKEAQLRDALLTIDKKRQLLSLPVSDRDALKLLLITLSRGELEDGKASGILLENISLKGEPQEYLWVLFRLGLKNREIGFRVLSLVNEARERFLAPYRRESKQEGETFAEPVVEVPSKCVKSLMETLEFGFSSPVSGAEALKILQDLGIGAHLGGWVELYPDEGEGLISKMSSFLREREYMTEGDGTAVNPVSCEFEIGF